MNLAKCFRPSLFSKQVVTSRGLTSPKFFSIENKRTEKLKGKLPLTNRTQMLIEVVLKRKETAEPIMFQAGGSSYT
jgi:hypothetical protein